MKGLIAVPCRPDQARHIVFFQNLLALEKPADTEVRLYPGFFPHVNRQLAADDATREGAEWILYIDDDQLLEPDTISKLLAHDVDVVTCNLLLKEQPWPPYLYTEGPHGLMPMVLTNQQELFQVTACGMGGVLVRTSALAKMPKPWFDINQECKTDDLYFCANAQMNGVKVHCDPQTTSGHIIRGAVWPRWSGTEWQTALDLHRSGTFIVPAARPSNEYKAWLESQPEVKDNI